MENNTSQYIENALKTGASLEVVLVTNYGAKAAFQSILDECTSKLAEIANLEAEIKFRIEQRDKAK